LAGGASLSSLGVASRSISSGLASFRKSGADPATNKVRPYVTDTLGEVAGGAGVAVRGAGVAVRGAGVAVRGAGVAVRGAAVQSRQALGRSWRHWRR